MYKLNSNDAVQLANDIKDIAAKVEKHNESKTLMFPRNWELLLLLIRIKSLMSMAMIQ